MSQTFTTITNVLTTSGIYSSNIYSTNTVGTTTETVTSTNTFLSTTDTIVAGNQHTCMFDYWNITVAPGTLAVTGIIGPPSSEIDFYIMTSNQYYYFNHSECGNTPYDAEVAVYDLTSTYTLNWKNPPAGSYYIVFSTEKWENNVIYTPFVLLSTFNQEQTSTMIEVETNQMPVTTTGTVTSLLVTQVSASIETGLSIEVIVAAVIAVLAIAGAVYLAKSRKKEVTRVFDEQESKAVRTTKKDDGKQFCLNCGKVLPVGSKFCNKCGTAQE